MRYSLRGGLLFLLCCLSLPLYAEEQSDPVLVTFEVDVGTTMMLLLDDMVGAYVEFRGVAGPWLTAGVRAGVESWTVESTTYPYYSEEFVVPAFGVIASVFPGGRSPNGFFVGLDVMHLRTQIDGEHIAWESISSVIGYQYVGPNGLSLKGGGRINSATAFMDVFPELVLAVGVGIR